MNKYVIQSNFDSIKPKPLKIITHFNLSPEENCESTTREGPLDSLSILYVIDEPKLGLQKYPTISDFLKVSKTFIPRREPKEVQLFLLDLY